MSWARLDDTYCDHPKVLRAWSRNPAAISLHVMSITYCARHHTDGAIPSEWLATKVPKQNERTRILDVLVDAGLFDLRGDEYFVHDFLEYNGSREDEEQRRAAISQARSEAGRKGAKKRWQTDSKPVANANGKPEQGANGSNSTRPDPSQPYPFPLNPPPSGGRKRSHEVWDKTAVAWARSVGVDGGDTSLLRAVTQSKPWDATDPIEHFRKFAGQWFSDSLTMQEDAA